MHSSVTIIGVIIGVVILFFGRKLFWLCVAAVGFAVGVKIAPLLVNESASLLALLIALIFGVLGALLALFLQKIAIAVLGFLAGGKLATAIAAAFFCPVCAILDHHFRDRRHHRSDFVTSTVWLGTDRCLLLYRRVLDSKRHCAAADRFDTRVHRSRDRRHIYAGSIVPQNCDLERDWLRHVESLKR